MTFADEVKQANSKPVESKPEVMDATIADFNSSADDQVPTEEPAAVEGVETPPQDAPMQTAEKKMRIRIGLKEFDSQEAALEYAQALELQNAENEGYKRAQEELKAKDVPVEIDEDEELSQLMFENPKEYVKRMQAKAQSIADAKVNQAVEGHKREAEKAQWWNGFWQANPDLQQSADIVEFMLQKNWQELGFIDRNEAAKKLADKTRQALRGTRDATLPTEVMPEGRARVAPASSTSTPKVEVKVDKPIDFVQQVNTIRNRTLKR